MPKGYFNKLEGHEGYSIMDPLLDPADIVSDPNVVFNANARKLYQSKVFDKYKPFYGYVLKAGTIISGEELYLHNEQLSYFASLEHQKDIMGYYVRIPLIHEPTLIDPEVVKREQLEAVIRSHTFCTVDPTRINSTIKIEPKTLVKIHFTDNNYSKGRIIGISSGVGGGVLGSVVGAILRGPSLSGGSIDCSGSPTFSPVTKKQTNAIILGASVGPTLQAQLKLDGVTVDRSAPDDGIATCDLAMQVGGRQNKFFLEQMDKVLANPQELAKYKNYKYVFVNSPNGNDFAAHGKSGGPQLLAYAKRESSAGSAQQLYNKLNQIFPSATGNFYIIKGSVNWGPMANLGPEDSAKFYEIAGYDALFKILKAQMIKEHHGDKSAITGTVYRDGTKGMNLSQQIRQIVNGGSDADITD